MHLKFLSIIKLHKALTLDVEFRTDVTLLVGINGSGKTSVLNCIEILLRPDMKRLATLDYERIALTFSLKGNAYTVVAEKSKNIVSLFLEGGPSNFQPITIKLFKNIDPDDDEASEFYARLSPEQHERPMWDFLKSLPRPIVITLDRTIAAEADDSFFFEINRPQANRLVRTRSPLDYVQEVTSAGYAEYRKRAIAADDELKAEIVMSALQEPNFLESGQDSKPLTTAELTRLEHTVSSYLSKTVKSGDVADQVRTFFQSSSRIATHNIHEKQHYNLLLYAVSSRYRQIESLAQAFNNYEKKITSAFRKLSKYTDTVNRFFKDSNKELFFEESTGRLFFSFLRDSEKVSVRRGIKHLSSGERQILILFTFLAFASTSSTIFIVDEPELSLHPKWQHEFMDAFLKLKPRGAQVLLATHSPEIVGKHKSACVPLRIQEN